MVSEENTDSNLIDTNNQERSNSNQNKEKEKDNFEKLLMEVNLHPFDSKFFFCPHKENTVIASFKDTNNLS